MFVLNSCVCLTPDEVLKIADDLDALADKIEEYSDPDDEAGRVRALVLEFYKLIQKHG